MSHYRKPIHAFPEPPVPLQYDTHTGMRIHVVRLRPNGLAVGCMMAAAWFEEEDSDVTPPVVVTFRPPVSVIGGGCILSILPKGDKREGILVGWLRAKYGAMDERSTGD